MVRAWASRICDAGPGLFLQESGAALAGMWGCARPPCVGHRHPGQVPASGGWKSLPWCKDFLENLSRRVPQIHTSL